MDYKLVIAVRSDLDLSRGKLAVQVAHAAVMAALEAKARHRKWFAEWIAEGQKRVVVQAPSYIEGVLTTLAEVDGHDATERIASMVRRSRYRAGLAAILIDGTAVGGFNVIDIDAVRAAVDRPVVTVTRKKPNLGSIETALRRRFDDWQERLAAIRRHAIDAIRTGHGSVWVTYVGASRTEVQEALSLTTVRGVLPEPLRVAHLIAAGIVRGESRGRA